MSQAGHWAVVWWGRVRVRVRVKRASGLTMCFRFILRWGWEWMGLNLFPTVRGVIHYNGRKLSQLNGSTPSFVCKSKTPTITARATAAYT